VSGYGASSEIAYGLGKFECWRSPSGKSWLIRDRYGFSRPGEAAAATPLAELLVALWGTAYSYKIESTIPVEKTQ
jgi:hypothetical protein